MSDINDKLKKNPLNFTEKTTGYDFYDNLLNNPEYFKESKGLLGRIVDLTPDEYVDHATELLKREHPKLTREELVNSRLKNTENIDKIKNFKEVHIPILSYGNDSGHIGTFQEGLHRALTAKELGMEKIPTLIAGGESRKNVPATLLQKLSKGGLLSYAIPTLAIGAGLYSAGSKAAEGDYAGAGEDVANMGTMGGYNVAKDLVHGKAKEAALEAANIGSYAVPVLGEARMAHDIGSLGGELAGSAARKAYNYVNEEPSVFQKELDEMEEKENPSAFSKLKNMLFNK